MLSTVENIDYAVEMNQGQDARADLVGVHHLAALIMGASQEMRASFEEVCGRYDLTPQQARALLSLKEKAPMRALAGHLRCDVSNITGIADRLEARSLVRRETPEKDRRVKLLTLTPEGERIRAELAQAVHQEAPVMAKLSAKERELLASLLSKVVGAAEAPATDV